MGFSEITEVVPWIAFASDCDQDLDAVQIQEILGDRYSLRPRLFKAHQRMAAINRGCRYITTIRDPLGTAVSYYNFYVAKGIVSADTQVSDWILKWAKEGTWHGSPWPFYVDAFKCLNTPGILVVCFEFLKTHLKSHVQVIADFMGLGNVLCMEEDCNTVVHLSSLDFMSKHDDQFDDHFLTDKQTETGRYGKCIMPRAAKVIAAGQTHAATVKDVDASARKLLEDCWTEHVHPQTGCKSYADMQVAVREAWGIDEKAA